MRALIQALQQALRLRRRHTSTPATTAGHGRSPEALTHDGDGRRPLRNQPPAPKTTGKATGVKGHWVLSIREVLPPDAGVPGPPEGDGGSAGTQKSGMSADEGPVRREPGEKPQQQSVNDGSLHCRCGPQDPDRLVQTRRIGTRIAAPESGLPAEHGGRTRGHRTRSPGGRRSRTRGTKTWPGRAMKQTERSPPVNRRLLETGTSRRFREQSPKQKHHRPIRRKRIPQQRTVHHR